MESSDSSLTAHTLNHYVKNSYNNYEQLLQLNGNYFNDCLTATHHHHHHQNVQRMSGNVRHPSMILSDIKDGGNPYENNNQLSPAI